MVVCVCSAVRALDPRQLVYEKLYVPIILYFDSTVYKKLKNVRPRMSCELWYFFGVAAQGASQGGLVAAAAVYLHSKQVASK